MKLYINNRFLFLVFENKNEEIEFKAHFTFNNYKNAMLHGKFNPRMVKKECFLNKSKLENTYYCYSGFLVDVLLCCKKNNIKVSEIKDTRTRFDYQKKEHSDEELSKYFPFEYNAHQIGTLRRLLKTSYGIAKLITGSGKSEIIFAFIKETGMKTLVLVDRKLLASQLYERMKEGGIDCGIWTSDKKRDGKQAIVATVGSVWTVPNLDDYKCLVIDECHHASSNQFQDFLTKTEFPVRVGFSATPKKSDEYTFATIRQFLGNIVFESDNEELLENKVIAKPYIYFIKNTCKPTLDWPSAYNINIVENQQRNDMVAELAAKTNQKTLILIKDVEKGQGEYIKEKIESLCDKTVVFVSGQSKEDKMETIKKLEEGKVDIIVSTNVMNEGVSIKTIGLVIIASGGKSNAETLQKIGRATRIVRDKEGNLLKDKAIVIDFMDLENKFTEKHSSLRKKLYLKEGFEEITECDYKELLDKIV